MYVSFLRSRSRIGNSFLRVLALAAAACFTLLFPTLASAQFRGSIQGTVADNQGGVIPGAKVTLTNTKTNETQTRTTNGQGVYNFNALGPSVYTIVATAKGFETKTLTNVKIIPEQANAINIQLAIAAAATTVTVDASKQALLDTETPNIAGTISADQIEHMPSFGRDVFQLTQLAPGTTSDMSQSAGGGTYTLPGVQSAAQGTSATGGIFATENGPQMFSSGGQFQNNGISIDGISTASAVWGGSSVITPSEESVDSVKVVTNGYDAENGRFSGAQIQVTSKSGSNAVHGSAFFQAWRPGLNAYQRYGGNPFAFYGPCTAPCLPETRGLNRDNARFNQMGGSLSGPFWKNHVFAFFSYETERNNSPSIGSGWYDTAAFDKLAPSGSIASEYLTFPGGAPASIGMIQSNCAAAGLIEGSNCITVPGQGLNIGSPMNKPLGTQDPTWSGPSNPGVGGGLTPGVADIAQFATSTPTSVVDQQFNGRLDADVTSRDRLTFAIYWVPENTTTYNGPARAYNLWHHSQINDAFTGIWNHTFSPNLLNEARANAAGWRWNEVASNPQEPWGLPNDSVGMIGSINLQNFGAPGPSVFDQWTYNYKDTATWVLHNHTIRFGGELTRLYYLNEQAWNARPSYGFFNIWDFLNDAPSSENGTFDPHTGVPTLGRQDDRENILGIFVQDDWKVKPSLTVNLGLRYSHFGSLYAKANDMYSVQFGSGQDWLTGINIKQGGDLWHPQKLNLGPQIGFAYSPGFWNQRFVVRGGYGINYNQNEIAITGQVSNNPGLTVQPSFTMGSPSSPNPGIVYAVPSDPHTLFGYPPNPNTILTFGPNGVPTNGTVGVTAFPNDMPTTYTEHFSLDTETNLGAQWVLTVGYNGSVSRHTYFHYDANAVASVNSLPLNPQITSVDYYSNSGHGSYNALLVGVRHQMARTFMIDSQFSWGRSMDTSSAPYSKQDYPYDPTLDWGRSDYDLNKQFKIYGLWQPVIFHNAHNWAEKVVGGWSLSGIFNWHSGFPWTPVYYTSASLYCDSCGYYQLLPAAYLGGAGHDTSNSAFISGPGVPNAPANKNFPKGGLAYFTPPAWTPGPTVPSTGAVVPQAPGIRRNSWTGPGYRDVDASLSKNFGLPYWRREGAGIEVRGDVYNLFNILNLNPSSISNSITASNFGQAQSALGSRTITLQARFQF